MVGSCRYTSTGGTGVARNGPTFDHLRGLPGNALIQGRMPPMTGRTIALSAPRRFIVDLLHFARKVPSVPVQRRMKLEAVARARQAALPRPSWVSIFAKAFGLVAARWPELRRSYLGFPVPRLYEHPVSIAAIAVERRVGEDTAVFFGKLRCPEERGLPE